MRIGSGPERRLRRWGALACVGAACSPATGELEPATPPSLPAPVANNAVVAARTSTGWAVLSFLGIDSTRAWGGVTSASYRWDVGTATWREIEPPPGPGRLAATAQAVGGRIFLFGGYTVVEDGTERSVPEVDLYDPESGGWSPAAPIPVPVDDAVSGVWRDSLVYLVSGWHDSGNEAAVQVYDPSTDSWRQATPIPGPPVFGHSGGIAGDAIVYVDGTRVDSDPRRFVLESSSWLGRIDPGDPLRIRWERLPDHPGPALYRAAAVGAGDRVFFAGGTDNPYNYDGVGYDGRPAEPLAGVFAFDLRSERWLQLGPLAVASMDHRGIAMTGDGAFVIGGMTAGQRVTDRVTGVPLR